MKHQVKIYEIVDIEAESMEQALKLAMRDVSGSGGEAGHRLEHYHVTGFFDGVLPHETGKHQLTTCISPNSLDKLECALDWVDISEHPELLALFAEVGAILDRYPEYANSARRVRSKS